jgi:DNA replication protein DnaC
MDQALDQELAAAHKQNRSTAQVLERLLEIEAVSLIERRIERRIKQSKLPERKLLADFDFEFQTGIDQKQIMDLATLGFVECKQWLILAGSSGTGKSHIAKALLLLACKKVYSCRYVTASGMLRDLLSGLAVRQPG